MPKPDLETMIENDPDRFKRELKKQYGLPHRESGLTVRRRHRALGKTYVSFSFDMHPDQVELLLMALDSARKQGDTKSFPHALVYLAYEFLASGGVE